MKLFVEILGRALQKKKKDFKHLVKIHKVWQ